MPKYIIRTGPLHAARQIALRVIIVFAPRLSRSTLYVDYITQFRVVFTRRVTFTYKEDADAAGQPGFANNAWA